jgi:hypothetical protein
MVHLTPLGFCLASLDSCPVIGTTRPEAAAFAKILQQMGADLIYLWPKMQCALKRFESGAERNVTS